MKTIEEKLKKVLKKTESSINKKQLKEFEEASKKFDELVKNGIITKRGNNQLSITDTHLYHEVFNGSLKSTEFSYNSNI